MKYNIDDMINRLDMYKGRHVVIKQEGFLKSNFLIQDFNYIIKKDILYINDNKSDTYITINLNQMYELIIDESKIKMSLDNDTEIEIIEEDDA